MGGPFTKNDPRINRNGRPPKGTAITDLLKTKLTAEEFTDILVALARKGDKDIIKHIYDRFEGKVVDTHILTDPDGEPQKIEFIIKNYTNGNTPS
jgi:hypothetical protein